MIFGLALGLAKYWSPLFQIYSQEILVLTEILILLTKFIESLTTQTNLGSVSTSILCESITVTVSLPPSSH
jgi:hypothetical protein